MSFTVRKIPGVLQGVGAVLGMGLGLLESVPGALGRFPELH